MSSVVRTIKDKNGNDLEVLVSRYFSGELNGSDEFPDRLLNEYMEFRKGNWDYIGYGYTTIRETNERSFNRIPEEICSRISDVKASFHPGDWCVTHYYDADGKLLTTDASICGEHGYIHEKIPHIPIDHEEIIINGKRKYLVIFRGNNHLPIATPIQGTNWERWYRWELDWKQRFAAELIKHGHKLDNEIVTILYMPPEVRQEAFDWLKSLASEYGANVTKYPKLYVPEPPKIINPRTKKAMDKQRTLGAWA